MASVVIAAHDEAEVIGACLAGLAAGPTPLQVVVVANGCSDATAALARRGGADVVEIDVASKVAALNAGDQRATEFPRLYLDADIRVPDGGVQRLVDALGGEDAPLVAVPARVVDVAGRPWPVRAYLAINTRLPAYENGLFGRGLVALSATGRGRFGEFPDVVADDLFLDSVFSDGERAVVPEVVVVVAAPRSTRALLRRLVRVRRGNADLRAAAGRGELRAGAVRPADRTAWFRHVVRPDLRLLPAAVVYVGLTCWAAALARRPARSSGWGQDRSTRQAPAPVQVRADG